MHQFYKKVIFLLFIFLPIVTFAQDSHTSVTKRPWYLPDHFVIQYAGNIGLLSAGPGYSYLRDKVNTEILNGITPGFESSSSIHSFTGKTSYHPFSIKLKKDYQFEPLKIGTGISYSLGPQFHTTWPGRYPADYYWWTTSFRITPFVGSTISRSVGNENTAIKRVELYYEVGTHDLHIVSYMDNKSLDLWKILNLAIGTKLVF